MPRGASASTSTSRARRRTTRGRSDASSVVGQIGQLIAANESLKRENAELLAINEQLREQLTEIGSALGRLAADPGRRGRGGAEPLLAEPKQRRQRRPITDPVLLERRRQALAKARAARAEKLAAAREEASAT